MFATNSIASESRMKYNQINKLFTAFFLLAVVKNKISGRSGASQPLSPLRTGHATFAA